MLEAMATTFGQPAEVLKALPPLGFSPDLEPAFVDVIPTAQRQYRESGVLSYTEDIPVEQLVDTSPVDRILAEG